MNEGSLIDCTVAGKVYRGTYVVEDGLVTVAYEGAEKTTQVGGLAPDHVARLLLSELVRGL